MSNRAKQIISDLQLESNDANELEDFIDVVISANDYWDGIVQRDDQTDKEQGAIYFLGNAEPFNKNSPCRVIQGGEAEVTGILAGVIVINICKPECKPGLAVGSPIDMAFSSVRVVVTDPTAASRISMIVQGIAQKVLPNETCTLCGDTSFEGRYGLIASLQAVAEDQRNFCPNCGRAIDFT